MDIGALGNLLSGLAGAVLGALVGAVAVTKVAARQIMADRQLQRRDELRTVIAQLWGACDALWVAQQDLAWTVVSMQIDRQSDITASKIQHAAREQSMAEIRAALKESRKALALIRLLHPDLVASAEELIATSRQFRPRPDAGDMGEEFEIARDQALADFERAARAQLGAVNGKPQLPSDTPVRRRMRSSEESKERGIQS